MAGGVDRGLTRSGHAPEPPVRSSTTSTLDVEMSAEPSACSGCQVKAAAVTRRDFVASATLTAVTMALTACGGGGDGTTTVGPTPPPQSPPSPPVSGQIVVTLSQYPVLSTVGAAVRVSQNPAVALARTPDGLVAYSLVCTHQGTIVNIESDYRILCPNHGARFTSAGVWTGGQQTTNLQRLAVAVNEGGTTATISTT